jgi:molybdopterin molybdotransferase
MEDSKNKGMIPLIEAVKMIQSYSSAGEPETANLDSALNRILAEDIHSDMDMPPFNKSAMDGFACRLADIEQELEIIETIPAGKNPTLNIGKGQCSRIMTGAPVPDGADCVVMVEDTEIVDGKMKVINHPGKSNICPMGEDIRKGNTVLKKGTRLKPQHISVLAAVGHVTPLVFREPVVAVIITGDEVVEPHIKPPHSKIRNSNGFQMLSLLKNSGCKAEYLGIFSDRMNILEKAINSAFETTGILIITGGASVGDYDLVPPVLEKLGFRVHFTRVAIQPGKPFSFSTRDHLVCFGLSGNPVSSFVQFELLVRPYIDVLLGKKKESSFIKVRMSERITRKNAEREFFFPVGITEEFQALPLEFHGSAHISALTDAFGIASMPAGKTFIEKGDFTDVRPI